MLTKPYEGLEVHLDMHPLYIYLRSELKTSTYRLCHTASSVLTNIEMKTTELLEQMCEPIILKPLDVKQKYENDK